MKSPGKWLIGIGVAAAGLGVFLWSRSAAARKPCRVVCLGNSITAAGIYCTKLEELLPPGSKTRCLGYVGKGTAAIAKHLDEALALNPTHVIVEAGINDLASGRSPSYVKAHLEEMYRRIASAGVIPVAVHLTPWEGYRSGMWAETASINMWIEQYSSAEASVRTEELGDAEGHLLPRYDSGDGLHLNKQGQIELARMILRQAF